MSETELVTAVWQSLVSQLNSDERITPQLMGFLALAEAKGVLGETLYLEVPNELTREMLTQRVRPALLDAIASMGEGGIKNYAVVVNPDVMNAMIATEEAFSSAPVNEPYPFTNSMPTSPLVQTELGGPESSAIGIGPGGSIEHLQGAELSPYDSPIFDELRESIFGKRKAAPLIVHTPTPEQMAESRLNPKYTFGTFVIGNTNRFAHAAAFAISESPAKSYNPLFIYGSSGLGKTHLLHATGHYALSLFPKLKVRYVSSEEFTNDFINSIQNNRSAEFQAQYRDIDILLVDDIQFLAGKDQTQEAFFHTFNTLHDHNKQVVITSDVPPKELRGFEERMISRFEWGLLTDIQAPEFETRIAILRKKAQIENLTVPDEVIDYMAARVSSNIRELEGTLIRITAFANLNRQPINLDLVQSILKDIVPLGQDSVVAPIEIIRAVADYYKISEDDLYGASRAQAIALARQIAMYLCRELTNLSLPKIGQLFGGKDHTTVMYATKKITEFMNERRYVYNQVTEIIARIKANAR
jgi:chromosomal replication initiator protein